ncbi:hypothetical protein [Polaromonas sp. A23]|uniref:hypothetical protein n=1 Tax=Polaromonas sp. A23 TaxID=1944133 RepID=UPI00352BB4AD
MYFYSDHRLEALDHLPFSVIATSDTLNVRQMVNTARPLNSAIEIVVRTHNEAEAKLLESENVGAILLGEQELAQAMTRHVLERSTAGSAHL